MADETLVVISGMSFSYESKLTVSVRLVGKKTGVCSGQCPGKYERNKLPKAYQNFFDALSKSLSMEAHKIEIE